MAARHPKKPRKKKAKPARAEAKSAHPKEETAQQVERMVAFGIPVKNIAAILSVTKDTLYKHYRDAVELGADRAVVKMANSVYERGLGGDTTCAIFFLKARGKWRDRSPLGDLDPPEGGGSVKVEIVRFGDDGKAAGK